MKLTSDNVHNTFIDCLFKVDGTRPKKITPENTIAVRGVMMNIGFDKAMIELHKQDIIDMILQLHENFMKTGTGKGWSFLNMNLNNDNRQWTDLHSTQDELVCMGMAIHKLFFLVERKLWGYLPHEMPYIVVDNE